MILKSATQQNPFEWEVTGKGSTHSERMVPVGIKERDAAAGTGKKLERFLKKIYAKLLNLKPLTHKEKILQTAYARMRTEAKADAQAFREEYPLAPSLEERKLDKEKAARRKT